MGVFKVPYNHLGETMIILIGSQKGGCGKSTTAANICAQLSQMKKDVVLVDADRQGTAENWASDREVKSELPVVHHVQKYNNIQKALVDLDTRYEFVIVDSAGRDSQELRSGSLSADILIIPFRPSQPDLDTLPKLESIIEQAKIYNPKLVVYGLLTMCPTNPKINESKDAKDYLSDYPDIHLLTTVICDRKVYRDAMSEGMGVTEMGNEQAQREIESLMQEIF